MKTRVVTGSIFVAVLLASVYIHPITLFLLFFAFTLIGTNEFYAMAKKAGASVQILTGIFSSAVAYALLSLHFIFNVAGGKYLLLIFVLPFIVLIAELYRKKQNPFLNISVTLLPLFYLALPFALLSYIAGYDSFLRTYNPSLLLGFFFLIWTNDTGAYLVGRRFGKSKLFPSISPNKTKEGALGGLLLTLAVAVLLSTFTSIISLFHILIIAAGISITGTYGDLIESMFKRSVGVKDSGSLMPGHGGVLDRFDGVLLSAPFTAMYLVLIS
jgi:phosphatidate cytidylyltransferase